MGFALFKLNCGYMPTIIRGITPFENAKPGVKRFINQAINNVEMAHNATIQSCVSQTWHTNHWQRKDDPFAISDKVYLSIKNLNLPKNRSRKLMAKFIRPYKVTSNYLEDSRYTLELPNELKAQRIHPLFHVSCLCPFKKNDDKIFSKCEVYTYYDFGNAEDEEWLVDNILAHHWEGNRVSFLVQWNLGDTTWEPYNECKELTALDRYLKLLGINDEDWKKLPRRSLTINHPSSNCSKANTPAVCNS